MSNEDDFPEDLLVFKRLTRIHRQPSGSESDADAWSLHSMASRRSVHSMATTATSATSAATAIGLRRNRASVGGSGGGGGGHRGLSRLASLISLLPGRRNAPVVCESPPPEAAVGVDGSVGGAGAVAADSADAAAAAPAGGCLSRRQLDVRACLQELLDLESRFYQRLECALRVYYEPLLQTSGIPEADVREMFHTLPSLAWRGPARLVNRLRPCLQRMRCGRGGCDDDEACWDAGGCGSALLEWATEESAEDGSLGRLVAYCTHLDQSRQAYDRLRRRTKFRDFIQRCLTVRRSLEGLDLWSHLHEPKSHMARYPLILSRLAGYLSSLDNDAEASRVRQAFDIVQARLTAIDCAMREQDRRCLAKKLLLSEACLPAGLLEPWRWLLQRQTRVLEKTAPGLVQVMPKRRPALLLLFSDLLIVAKVEESAHSSGASSRGDAATASAAVGHENLRCRQLLLLCGLSASTSGVAQLNLRGVQLASKSNNWGIVGKRHQTSSQRWKPQPPAATAAVSLCLSFGQNAAERSHWLSLIQSAHSCTAACHGSGATMVTETPLRQGSQHSTESGYCTDH
ncbi:hypothetical protein BOX15_Mlig015489g4 [Macrostomum lignano]|uniref:DH domain-containing protein n=3 Tax=Macrostomum lignano TaxID=282301 RepID=A0A1I8J2J1_9PLAT|nr:hypothetical protein BOX15_Mlig015489g4 [Macrostomum lignano]